MNNLLCSKSNIFLKMKRIEEKQVANIKEERKEKSYHKKEIISPFHALSDTEGSTALDAPCFRVPASVRIS